MSADGLNPKGPSQPTLGQAYETAGNPADQEPAEKAQADFNARSNSGAKVDQRIPTKQTTDSDEATPSSLGRGVRGAGPGEEASGRTEEDVGRNQELEGEQMAAPGEGKVADAVQRHAGASGSEPGLETDLDRKKAEQAPLRDQVKEQKKEDFDVGGVLGQRGGPANPVGKDNYPNSDR